MKPVAVEEARMAGEEMSWNLPLSGEKTNMAPQSTRGCPAVCPEEEKKQTKNQKSNRVEAMKKALLASGQHWQSEDSHARGMLAGRGMLVEPLCSSMDR